ncbi:MAG TPA: (deoxy)nucleoside triphosphate pyrophosphohydrolase [Bacteroidetes bacterium]|nr:(deoxy)nucleoside triphosphate pyrophosphohydrolase [Bacteroidota bacterium]
MNNRKLPTHLRVTCALILQQGRVLCTQRSSKMSLPLKWEFPGGKIEKEESPETCIIREIKEELNLEIEITGQGPTIKSPYKDGVLELTPFICREIAGPLHVNEHAAICWASLSEMENLDWARADIAILKWWQKHYHKFLD